MTPLHTARLKASWKDYQKRYKLSHEQMTKKIGCPSSVAKALLQNRLESFKTPYAKVLIELLGNQVCLDYQPPHRYRTFVSATNRFQVSELDLVVAPRPSDFETEQDKIALFVQRHQELFRRHLTYAAATQGCEEVDKMYTVFKQAMKTSSLV